MCNLSGFWMLRLGCRKTRRLESQICFRSDPRRRFYLVMAGGTFSGRAWNPRETFSRRLWAGRVLWDVEKNDGWEERRLKGMGIPPPKQKSLCVEVRGNKLVSKACGRGFAGIANFVQSAGILCQRGQVAFMTHLDMIPQQNVSFLPACGGLNRVML